MASSTESGRSGSGVADALRVSECKCFVGVFAMGKTNPARMELGLGAFGATDMGRKSGKKLVRTAELRRIGH